MSGVSTAQDIRSDYLLLLVTQLRNQNPLEPMDNNQMATQLAQLSQLEQMENMSSTFRQVLHTQQSAQAAELIGKTVSFFPSDSTALQAGKVDGVKIDGDQVVLTVGSFTVGLGEIQHITD